MNNNPVTSGDIEEKKGRKREAGKDFEGIVKPRPKRKKMVKKISSEVEEVEEELKPGEEKVTHKQKARLSVKDNDGWEERGSDTAITSLSGISPYTSCSWAGTWTLT